MYKNIFILLALLSLAACTPPGTTPSGTSTITKTQSSIASPTQGTGKHKLTIFADFQCPACIGFSKAIGPIFEQYAADGYLQITYKQFPLQNHKNAERDALAALCSEEQGKYIEYKKALYALEESKSSAKVTDEDRVNIGKDIVDTTKLAACLAGDKYLDQVRAEVQEGEALGVTGTPTVFLDGKKIDNKIFSNLDAMKNIMNRWLEVPETGSGK
jgi:protein-disulfide isomerase